MRHKSFWRAIKLEGDGAVKAELYLTSRCRHEKWIRLGPPPKHSSAGTQPLTDLAAADDAQPDNSVVIASYTLWPSTSIRQ